MPLTEPVSCEHGQSHPIAELFPFFSLFLKPGKKERAYQRESQVLLERNQQTRIFIQQQGNGGGRDVPQGAGEELQSRRAIRSKRQQLLKVVALAEGGKVRCGKWPREEYLVF